MNDLKAGSCHLGERYRPKSLNSKSNRHIRTKPHAIYDKNPLRKHSREYWSLRLDNTSFIAVQTGLFFLSTVNSDWAVVEGPHSPPWRRPRRGVRRLRRRRRGQDLRQCGRQEGRRRGRVLGSNTYGHYVFNRVKYELFSVLPANQSVHGECAITVSTQGLEISA